MDDIEHLTSETRRWYASILERHQLSPDKQRILLTAAESFDRGQACRQEVEARGMMLVDRYGQPKIHPAVDSQKSAAATFLAAMKALALDGLGEPLTQGPASKYLA